MYGSRIQQAGVHSLLSLSFSRGSDERADLKTALQEISESIHKLKLDERGRRKAEVQIATIQAQLADDEPESGIIASAGVTLRNVTEGAIASLLAAAAQPTIWRWVSEVMTALFAK
jgi:hypothetical protein